MSTLHVEQDQVYSIGSNNHVRKGRLQGNQTLLQLRQPLVLTQSRERKVKGKKQMSGRVIHLQHVTLNHPAQPAKLWMVIGTKGGLSQKPDRL